MKRILFIVGVFLIFLDQTAIAEETWKLEKNKNEIKVWTRKPVNSSLKEFKSILYSSFNECTIDKNSRNHYTIPIFKT